MKISTKQACIIYLVFEILFFGQVIFKDWILYPHDNRIEVGLPTAEDSHSSNRKFSDQSRSYIPNLQQHLLVNQWDALAVVDPNVQLGKPVGQLGALSRAYLTVNLLSFLTADPLRLLTWYVVITVVLGGVFFGCLLSCLGVTVEIALMGAVLFANGLFLTYWQSFPMTISLFVWSAGLLLAARLALRRCDGLSTLFLGFAIYSLLMTAGPQGVVLMSYLLVPLVVADLWKLGVTRRRLLSLVLPGILGTIAVIPVYWDLAQVAQQSNRLEVRLEDYVKVLPSIRSSQDLLREVIGLFDVFLMQTSEDSALPYSFNGHCFLPAVFTLFVLSFTYLRGFWILKAYAVLCVLGTFSPQIYSLYFNFLGFSLSRCVTLGGLVIAAPLLAMLVLDSHRKRAMPIKVVSGVYFLLLGCACYLRWPPTYYLLLNISIFSLLLLYLKYGSTVALLAILGIQIYSYSADITLFRPKDSIHFDSPIVTALRESTDNGKYRFAKIGLARDLLSSNQECLWGLKSIHSNDSLSSQDYQNLIAQLSSAKTGHYGRISASLGTDAKVDSKAFSYLGVSALVSKIPLRTERFVLRKQIDEFYLYQSREWPKLLFTKSDLTGEVDAESTALTFHLQRKQPHQILIKLEGPVESTQDIMLSEQWHPNWIAVDQNGENLVVRKLKDFYLGVAIRPTTEQITLSYHSSAKGALAMQAMLAIITSGLVFLRLKRWSMRH